MVALREVLDVPTLDTAIRDGYVRKAWHPSLPLVILNYTERCTYDRAWDATTRSCRGLIVRVPDRGEGWTGDEEVVARPFPKFFNLEELPESIRPGLDEPAVVTDKLDGSLGILYPRADGLPSIATRGSFESEQALHASALLREKYPSFRPAPDLTYLFEIVYPENRIVVDYGQTDDLFLLDVIETSTGLRARDAEWLAYSGPWCDEQPHQTLAEALAAPPRPNAEGYVVYFPARNARVKLKQEDYVALHRIVTGLTERRVWEHLSAGGTLSDLLEPLPEEFWPWVQEVATGLLHEVQLTYEAIEEKFTEVAGWGALLVCDGVQLSREARKQFAIQVKDEPDAWALFALLDGRDIMPELWRRARPPHRPFRPAAAAEEDEEI